MRPASPPRSGVVRALVLSGALTGTQADTQNLRSWHRSGRPRGRPADPGRPDQPGSSRVGSATSLTLPSGRRVSCQVVAPSVSLTQSMSSVPSKTSPVPSSLAYPSGSVPSPISRWIVGRRCSSCVVVRAVGVGQEPQPVGDRPQRQAEGVGRAAFEPADRARGDAHQHHARLPGRVHGRSDPVQPPQGQQVGDAAAGDPDNILGEQMLLDVGDVGLGEQRQVARAPSGPAEGGVDRQQHVTRVPHGGADNADPGGVARPRERGRQPIGRSQPPIHRALPRQLEADTGGDDRRVPSVTRAI